MQLYFISSLPILFYIALPFLDFFQNYMAAWPLTSRYFLVNFNKFLLFLEWICHKNNLIKVEIATNCTRYVFPGLRKSRLFAAYKWELRDQIFICFPFFAIIKSACNISKIYFAAGNGMFVNILCLGPFRNYVGRILKIFGSRFLLVD